MPSIYQPRTPQPRFIAGHAALDLVNTLEWRFRPTGSRERLTSYAEVVRFAVWSGVLPERVGVHLLQTVGSDSQKWILECVKNMREVFAGVVYVGVYPPKDGLSSTYELDNFLRNAVSEVYWIPQTANSTRDHWAFKSGMENGAELPLSLLAGQIVNFTDYEDLKKLRYCRNPMCRKVFLDFSRVGRKWCDMNRCGSAQKRINFQAKKNISLVPSGAERYFGADLRR